MCLRCYEKFVYKSEVENEAFNDGEMIRLGI